MATFTVENTSTHKTMEVTEEQWATNQLFKSSKKWKIAGKQKAKVEKPVATASGASQVGTAPIPSDKDKV